MGHREEGHYKELLELQPPALQGIRILPGYLCKVTGVGLISISGLDYCLPRTKGSRNNYSSVIKGDKSTVQLFCTDVSTNDPGTVALIM